MDQIIDKLFEIAPQLGLGVLFIAALALLLKEYRALRNEMHQGIADAVNSRLGSLMGDLQLQASEAAKKLKEIGISHLRVREMSEEVETRITERTEHIERTLQEIESRLDVLQETVPERTDYTARDLAQLAMGAESLGQATALIKRASEDPDATSRDLEVAGDAARRFRRYKMAADLYSKAVERDPENLSAKFELLCILAEVAPEKRDTSLEEARAIVVRSMSPAFLGRLTNALLTLSRYQDLLDVCQAVLDKAPPHHSDIFSQAHRDLGVALMNLDKPDAAEEHFRTALDADPDDENVLSALAAMLRQTGRHEDALEYYTRLLMLDPLDASYYYALGEIHNAIGDVETAQGWFDKAARIATPGPMKEKAERQRHRAALRIGLAHHVQRDPADLKPETDEEHHRPGA